MIETLSIDLVEMFFTLSVSDTTACVFSIPLLGASNP